MVVDSMASDHLPDDDLIPRLCISMEDYKELMEPKIIVTAANEKDIRDGNWYYLGTHHRSDWAACSSSHLRNDCTWIRTKPPLLRQINGL